MVKTLVPVKNGVKGRKAKLPPGKKSPEKINKEKENEEKLPKMPLFR